MSSIVIIDYGSGNIRSVGKAFEHVALETSNIIVSSDARALETASHIVLPGVGAFADCMAGLSALPDMLDVLKEQVMVQKKWFLGVCVGMQMLFERGHEHGVHDGLGWLKGEVVPLAHSSLKIPHMGWNALKIQQKSSLLAGVEDGDHAYFVHSYHAKLTDNSKLLAAVEYGEKIAAVVGSDNIFGTQFHPEKSQKTGLRILENFVRL
ncbi:MAG: imidazole glycerol phosphate synthase subunit HisH [Rickettsiales bacterium]|jgi:glutamine amidotransferase